MNRSAILSLAACLLLPAFAHAADAAAGGAKKKKAAEEASEESKGAAPEKKRFENYLKARLAKINDNHGVRQSFMKKEGETWENFWSKVRDERKLFEQRQTQQMLSTFQSLTSLEPAQRAAPVADFERMQGGVIKSFEAQQRAKMIEFFAARDAAWKEFAAAQEAEREEFVAAAAADWQRRKAELLEQESAPVAKASKKAAADDDESEEEEEEEAKPKKKKKASLNKQKASPDEQNWH
jgi:hypothetical protein